MRALEKYFQRFKIDDHLKRHESALRNLNFAGMFCVLGVLRIVFQGLTGPDRFEEALAHIESQ